MTPPLTLQPAPCQTAPVSAGWLPSADPVEWLAEMAHCRQQGKPVAIYAVAASATDPRAAGVLLLPRHEPPHFRPRVQLLVELLPGVHAPQHSAFSAGLLPNEVEFHFRQAVHFFHPTLGLIGFGTDDEISPAKLLHPPLQRPISWDRAIPAAIFAPVFRSIAVAEPPSPDELLADAAKEIGDQPGKTPGAGVLDKAAGLGKGLAGGALLGAGMLLPPLGKISGLLGGGNGGGIGRRSGSDDLMAWAHKNWKQLTSQRSREIQRLKKLLETNPDEGLRYALPLAGFPGRGRSTPGGRLGRRSTIFSHGAGGGAVDGWDLDLDSRLQLERHYREAALREIARGNFDRAAYIYGNLLGEWNTAANALSDAGRHQDAVAIYLHKLNNRPAAAASLEKAGLLMQAAAMYAECRMFEKAGDLHTTIGNDAQAREMWLAEVEAQSSALVKARLLSEKLGDDRAALAVLSAAWKAGVNSEKAIAAMFAICRKLNDPAAATVLLRRIFEAGSSPEALPVKLSLAQDEDTLIRHPGFHAEFLRLSYHHIAAAIAASSQQTSALLSFLPGLHPGDTLLSRDAHRYSLRKEPPKIARSGSPEGNLRPEQVIRIGAESRWDSLATLPRGVSFAGYGRSMLATGQFRENGCHSAELRTTDDPGPSRIYHLAVTSSRGTSRLIHFLKHRRLHYRALDRMRTGADDAIGQLHDVLAIGPAGSNGDFAVLQHTKTSSLTVHLYTEAADLRKSIPLDIVPPTVAEVRWLMTGRGDDLCFAVDHFFTWRSKEGVFTAMQMGSEAERLCMSPAAAEVLICDRHQVLVVLLQGKAAKSLETINVYTETRSKYPPVACYLPDGAIAIAWQGGGEIFASQDRVNASARFSLPTDLGQPIDIAAKGGGGFAVLTAKGHLVIFSR